MRHFTSCCPHQLPQNRPTFSQTKGFSLKTQSRHCSRVSVSFPCILRSTFISTPYMKVPFPTLQFQTSLYDYADINIRDGVRSLSNFAHAGFFLKGWFHWPNRAFPDVRMAAWHVPEFCGHIAMSYWPISLDFTAIYIL